MITNEKFNLLSDCKKDIRELINNWWFRRASKKFSLKTITKGSWNSPTKLVPHHKLKPVSLENPIVYETFTSLENSCSERIVVIYSESLFLAVNCWNDSNLYKKRSSVFTNINEKKYCKKNNKILRPFPEMCLNRLVLK